MLNLTLSLEEEVRIGDDIIIKFTKRKGSQIQIGVTAPKEILILRDKNYRRKDGKK